MKTRQRLGKASLLVLAVAALFAAAAPAANAASYFVSELEIRVGVSVPRIWNYIWDFCTVAIQGTQPSRCIQGAGGVGSIRLLADGTQELMVAQGPFFYAYEAVVGPMAAAHYHVAINVEEIDPLQSRILVTMIWDEEAVPAADREGTRLRLRQIVQAAMEDAKVVAEAS